jgi:hypothetical protein
MIYNQPVRNNSGNSDSTECVRRIVLPGSTQPLRIRRFTLLHLLALNRRKGKQIVTATRNLRPEIAIERSTDKKRTASAPLQFIGQRKTPHEMPGSYGHR